MKWIFEVLSRVFRNGVSQEVCTEVQLKNDMVIDNLKDWVRSTEERATARFTELKDDMRCGFNEVKQLIKDRGT